MKRKVLAVFILLVMLASIPVGVFLVKKRQEIQLRAAPATVLSLFPEVEDYEVDEVFTLNVNIDTGENLIVSADIILNYDPSILEGVEVTMGSFLPGAQELNKNINNDLGKIIYSLYTTQENAQQGGGALVSITFKGVAPGTSTVVIDKSLSLIGGLGEKGQNLLVSATDSSYLIADAESQPTITPTQTLTPTPIGVGGGEEPTATPTPTTTDQDLDDENGTGGGTEPTAT
ncbi:MAG TPA: cohesin domain-containing protein, partial [Candidatus Bathyarchaeia archaeon]|nr:cohesin domain-containing protein [Candidatus Bathyarchaeia archaeon]